MFKKYAPFYDLMYKDKDYTLEAEYIKKLGIKYHGKIESILDLGSGTGKHAELLHNMGYEVTGVELSKDMYEVSKQKEKQGLNFINEDLRRLNLDQKFSAVVSLFHVFSYQTDKFDISNFLSTASRHLSTNGLLIFDFWYGPAVINDPPKKKKKVFESDTLKIIRKTKPIQDIHNNIVDVNFKFKVTNKKTENKSKFEETHPMRYFFAPEIDYYLEKAGFKMISCSEFLTGNKLKEDSFNACVVAKLR